MGNNNEREYILALAGNPNSGKTSLFNSLTGARQHVGNWPGVTVEKKEGSFISDGKTVKVIDLPGTYSLGAFSEDEAVARDYIINEKPDVVVNIVDSTNIERNMYLTSQLLEMGANIIVALNMYDEAKAKNIEIDIDGLADMLGVPVLPTVATKNKGLKELSELFFKSSDNVSKEPLRINYGKEIEESIGKLQEEVKKEADMLAQYDSRWLSIKLLEGDRGINDFAKKFNNYDVLEKMRLNLVKKLEAFWNDDIESIFAEKRYGFIKGIVKETVKRQVSTEEKLSISDKIDLVATNKFLGIPIFLLAMWGIFQFTFTLGNPIADLIEVFFGW
ncbi:MAG: ferrous iron transporter B, partial [Bacillota bacterium]|nr:ferrous iron transporter B [Bacillota bacterium]